jgi:hypothetical protein
MSIQLNSSAGILYGPIPWGQGSGDATIIASSFSAGSASILFTLPANTGTTLTLRALSSATGEASGRFITAMTVKR